MSFLGSGSELKPGWKPGPRWRQRWWWRERIPGIVAVVVLATLMGLAGWLPFYFNDRGDDSPAHPRDTASGEPRSLAPSGTPHPTEQPPELPDAAHQFSDKGIEAAVRFEYAALNYAQRTSDLEPLKKIYNTSQCRACALLVERLTDLASRGKHLEGADYVVSKFKTTFLPGDNGELIGYVIFSAKQLSDYEIVDKTGKRLEIRKAQSDTEMNHKLSFIGGSWNVIFSDVNSR